MTYYSGIDEFNGYLETNDPEILLIRESELRYLKLDEGKGHTFLLTDVLEEEKSEQHVLFMYQSMQEIIRKLFQEEESGSQLLKSDMMVEVGRKNIFLLFLLDESLMHQGTNLILDTWKKKQKTLCVSLLPFDHVKEGRKGGFEQPKQGVSDLIYHLSNGTQSQEVLQKMITYSKTVDYVMPVNHCLEIMDFRKEMVGPFSHLLQGTGYECVLLLASVLTEAIIEIANQCQGVFLLSLDSSNHEYIKAVKEQIENLLGSKKACKIESVCVADRKNLIEELQQRIQSIQMVGG